LSTRSYFLEDLRAQMDRFRVVDTVHVAEGQRGQVATALPRPQCLDGGTRIVDGGGLLFVDLMGHAVLLASDHADLYPEERVRFHRRLQQSSSDAQVFVERDCGPVPHVRLIQRVKAAAATFDGVDDQRPDPVVEILGGQ
jgi:hypothetical protein